MGNIKFLFTYHFLWIFFLLFVSCSGLKKLPEGSRLYTGAQVKVESQDEIPKEATLIQDLKSILRPEPNNVFLGMRPGLTFYNMVGEVKKEKGFKHWLKYKIGAPPVLLEDVAYERMKLVLENRLFNSGYFDARVEAEVIMHPKKPKARVEYTAHLRRPYLIDSIDYPEVLDSLSLYIRGLERNSLLEKDQIYSLGRLKSERERIADTLKDKGYFFFAPDYLIFDADTTFGPLPDRKVYLHLRLKEELPGDALKAYRMRNLYLFPDYYSQNVLRDTIPLKDYYYVTRSNLFRPSILLNALFLHKGDYYDEKAHARSIRYLEGMEMFRLVNSRIQRTEDSSRYELDGFFYLTPKNSTSLRSEVGVNSKTNSFVGPELNVSMTNRNVFRGAEQLVTDFNAAYEVQVGVDDREGDRAIALQAKTSLLIPRILPRGLHKKEHNFVPFTKATLGARYFNRLRFYTLASLNGRFGYNYTQSVRSYYELDPVAIDYVDILNTTPEFDSLLEVNPSLAQSFEEQFIVGSQYNYSYNNFSNKKTRHHLAYFGLIGFSGNLLWLGDALLNGEFSTPDDQYEIFDSPISQYSRHISDIRYYYDFNERQKLATRFIFGLGVPYGNSEVLPYIKRFFVGGINSIRAFAVRSIGPGSFDPQAEDVLPGAFLQQVGELKLETNFEFRYPIISYLKGALFLDIGNVWLLEEDLDLPGGEFVFSDFVSELAVGTGLGFRLDVDVVVVRLDLAFPLRKPFLPEGERWTFNEINPWNINWWRDEVILNFAIGYPF
jgi:outer membrane protein insertion porin family